MIYRELLPGTPLRPLLRCCWSVRGLPDASAASRRVLPDGCADLLFDLGGDPMAHWIGTMTRAIQVPARHVPVDLFGLRFAPGGLHALLDEPSLDARLRHVEAALWRLRPDADALRAVTALAALERDRLPSSVRDLSICWGLTERTLERRDVRPQNELAVINDTRDGAQELRLERLMLRGKIDVGNGRCGHCGRRRSASTVRQPDRKDWTLTAIDSRAELRWRWRE